MPRCGDCGAEMTLLERLSFEQGLPVPTITALEPFRRVATDLGAEVTLYACHTCGRRLAEVAYSGD